MPKKKSKKSKMNKYIIQLGMDAGEDEDMVVDQFAVKTAMSVEKVLQAIHERSIRIQAEYYKPLNRAEAKVVSINRAHAMAVDAVEMLCTLRFEVGSVIIPHNLITDEVLVFTMDEWFDYCLRE
jgi:GTPase Era involved in 16S rRNA processing